MSSEVGREFMCLFCGEQGQADRVTIDASWDRGDKAPQQTWWAHRECLIDRLNAKVRAAGGPVVEDDFDRIGPAED